MRAASRRGGCSSVPCIFCVEIGRSWRKAEGVVPPSVPGRPYITGGKHFVSGSWDKLVKVWNTKTGDEVGSFVGLR